MVGMYLGVGKCAVAHLRARRVQQLGGATSDSGDMGWSRFSGPEAGQGRLGVPAEGPGGMEFLPLSCCKG